MKKFSIFILILFSLINEQKALENSSFYQSSLSSEHEATYDQLNFDALEDEATKINSFDTVEHKPLGLLTILLRKMGRPFLSIYCFAYSSWQRLVGCLVNKNNNDI